jgi:UDP-N-acetylmuramoylalanine-D-glutamate ligase
MKRLLAKLFPERHPLRLLYHKIMGVTAAVINGFPGNKMIVIGVTGTKGKSTTVNFITNILNTADVKLV